MVKKTYEGLLLLIPSCSHLSSAGRFNRHTAILYSSSQRWVSTQLCLVHLQGKLSFTRQRWTCNNSEGHRSFFVKELVLQVESEVEHKTTERATSDKDLLKVFFNYALPYFFHSWLILVLFFETNRFRPLFHLSLLYLFTCNIWRN